MFGTVVTFIALLDDFFWWWGTYQLRQEAREAADRFVESYNEFSTIKRTVDE